MSRSIKMKIELEDDFFYNLKDSLMVDFLKEDLSTVKWFLERDKHPVDIKNNKKVIKAYKTILKYYGVNDD